MSIIVWIVIGGLAGWIGNMIMKTDGGLLKNVVTGIIGALVGGFVMSFFGASGFTGFTPSKLLEYSTKKRPRWGRFLFAQPRLNARIPKRFLLCIDYAW